MKLNYKIKHANLMCKTMNTEQCLHISCGYTNSINQTQPLDHLKQRALRDTTKKNKIIRFSFLCSQDQDLAFLIVSLTTKPAQSVSKHTQHQIVDHQTSRK